MCGTWVIVIISSVFLIMLLDGQKERLLCLLVFFFFLIGILLYTQLGMASGMETLCGQAYGAKQYQAVGLHLHSCIISLLMVSVSLSLIWVMLGKILIFIGQDPLISVEAGKYAMWMIPGLFAYAILQSLMKFLQSQSLILPMLLGSFAVLCFHVPLCWILVFKSRLANHGAALAISLSYWLNVLILAFYVKYSSSCEKTRVPFSREVFKGIGKFFHLAIPSAVMIWLVHTFCS